MLFKKKFIFKLSVVSIFAVIFFTKTVGVASAADFGFNLWNLATQPPDTINRVLGNLKDSCKTTIVRIWGFQQTHGIDGLNNLQKVFDNAPPNVKFIVALEDFPFGPPEGDPGAWFGGGYRATYREYVRQIVTKYRGKVFMWELMNEPHCKGDASCPAKLTAWARDISNLIRSIDSTALISAGMIGDNLSDQAYEAVTALPNITANSCHFYNTAGPETQCNTPKAVVKGQGKYFYVGEAGYSIETACSSDVLKARAAYFQQKQTEFDPDAFLIWQFQMEGAGDQFSVVTTTDPICTGSTGDVPPDACNVSGDGKPSKLQALYGRDPYNRLATRNRYYPWDYLICPAISSDQWKDNHSLKEFITCEPYGEREGKMSCPDYSPNRPYPGDTCIDFLYTDQPNLVKYSQKDFLIGGETGVNLCNAATQTCLDQWSDGSVTATVNGKAAVYYKNSFVDFLGTDNEYTSNPNYSASNAAAALVNKIKRTALFLTDFLGGMVDIPGVTARQHEIKDYLDAYLELRRNLAAANNDPNLIARANQTFQSKVSLIPNLRENLQMTAGVLGKGMTDEAKKEMLSRKNVLVRYLENNKPHDATGQGYGQDPTNTPVGDYVIAYKCDDSEETFLNEEDFNDPEGGTLERRIGTNSKTGGKCGKGNAIPIRISDFLCSASNTTYWDRTVVQIPGFSWKKDQVCRGKEKPYEDTDSGRYRDVFSHVRFSPEDLAVIEEYFLSEQTHEDVPVRVVLKCPSSGNPDNLPVASGSADLVNNEEVWIRDNAPGGKFAIYHGIDKNGVPSYTLVTRTYIYVGHLAEAREQSFKASQLLYPSEIWENKTSPNFAEDELDSNTKIQEKIKQIQDLANVSQKGDLIAEDAANRYAGDSWQFMNYEITKKIKYTDPGIKGAVDDWYRGPKTSGMSKNVPLAAECDVSVEIPYLKDTAAYTIGKTHGIYRLFFPESQLKAIDELVEADKNRGMMVSASQYAGADGETDQKFFLPWVGEMQIFNMFLNNGVNPLSTQKGTSSTSTTGSTGSVPPDTAATSCLTQGVSYTDTSYDAQQLNSMFSYYQSQYPNSALRGAYGRILWDRLISISADGGMNPYLALAYWGEETHFTDPAANGNPKMGLGCGAPPGGSSCIADGTDDQEFTAEFQCFSAQNPAGSGSCNNKCIGQSSTFAFIGCYQNGAGNPPSANHLRNLMIFYHRLKGDELPSCP